MVTLDTNSIIYVAAQTCRLASLYSNVYANFYTIFLQLNFSLVDRLTSQY
jgi:hypothetical protein